jgi:hypothetical protein
MFAKRRFIEGCDTVALMKQAKSRQEREEIALVCLLDVDDQKIRDLELCCQHAGRCAVFDCREKLKKMIETELAS